MAAPLVLIKPVVERHRATGNIGKGLIKGFGLKKGALATSFAHDSRNVLAVGVTGQDIYTAVREVEACQGGFVVVADDQVVASLALPVAGLLSERPLEEVVAKLRELERAASELGCVTLSPVSVLSFLALPVIPELRLTDLGLVDVRKGQLLSPLPAWAGNPLGAKVRFGYPFLALFLPIIMQR